MKSRARSLYDEMVPKRCAKKFDESIKKIVMSRQEFLKSFEKILG